MTQQEELYKYTLETLNAINNPNIKLSAIIYRAMRIARFRNDFESLIYFETEITPIPYVTSNIFKKILELLPKGKQGEFLINLFDIIKSERKIREISIQNGNVIYTGNYQDISISVPELEASIDLGVQNGLNPYTLLEFISILTRIKNRIHEYLAINEHQLFNELTTTTYYGESLDKLDLICRKFHIFAHALESRHNMRTPLIINDEYDLQYLMYAILKLFFEDVRREEWTPSCAGRSARIDFLLRNESVVVELKKTRKGSNEGKIGEELIIDIAKYQEHPSCKVLYCFIYDPEGIIMNPTGLENDLSKKEGDFIVRTRIAPKGY